MGIIFKKHIFLTYFLIIDVVRSKHFLVTIRNPNLGTPSTSECEPLTLQSHPSVRSNDQELGARNAVSSLQESQSFAMNDSIGRQPL